MSDHNQHRAYSLEWMAWKEQHEDWTPYHTGTTPEGMRCPTMPRVVLARPGVYRCPSCGKEFPTATAELARREVEPTGGAAMSAPIWRSFLRCAITALECALDHAPDPVTQRHLDTALSLLRCVLEGRVPAQPDDVEAPGLGPDDTEEYPEQPLDTEEEHRQGLQRGGR